MKPSLSDEIKLLIISFHKDSWKPTLLLLHCILILLIIFHRKSLHNTKLARKCERAQETVCVGGDVGKRGLWCWIWVRPALCLDLIYDSRGRHFKVMNKWPWPEWKQEVSTHSSSHSGVCSTSFLSFCSCPPFSLHFIIACISACPICKPGHFTDIKGGPNYIHKPFDQQ